MCCMYIPDLTWRFHGIWTLERWTAMTIYNTAINYNTPIDTCDTYFNELRYRSITPLWNSDWIPEIEHLSLCLFLKLILSIYLSNSRTNSSAALLKVRNSKPSSFFRNQKGHSSHMQLKSNQIKLSLGTVYSLNKPLASCNKMADLLLYIGR